MTDQKEYKLKLWSKSHEQLLHFPSLTSLFRKASTHNRLKEVHVHNLPPDTPSKEGFHHPTLTKPRITRPRTLKTRLSVRFKSLIQSKQSQFASMDILPKKLVISRNPFDGQLCSTPGSVKSPIESWRPGEVMSSTSLNVRENSLHTLTRNARVNACRSFERLETPVERYNNQNECRSMNTVCTSDMNELDAVTDFSNSDLSHPEFLIHGPPEKLQIHIVRILGSGASGFCHEVEVRERQSNGPSAYAELPSKCTLKVIPRQVFLNKRVSIQREILIQREFNHLNLLRLFLAYYETRMKAVCLLLEYCSIGSLNDLVNAGPHYVDNDTLNKSSSIKGGSTGRSDFDGLYRLHDSRTGGLCMLLTRPIFCGLMEAVGHLHEKYGIVHRDIKPSNILLSDGFVAKLSDFGLACTEEQCWQERHQICGTPNYLAPEIFLKDGHSKRSDFWSAGATLYFMACGRPPFDPLTHSRSTERPRYRTSLLTELDWDKSVALPSKVRVRLICRSLLWGRYEFPFHLEQPARQVIRHLLQRNPLDRPDANKVMQMAFCQKSKTIMSTTVTITAAEEPQTDEQYKVVDPGPVMERRSPSTHITKPVSRQIPSEKNRFPVEAIEFVPDIVCTGREAIFDIFKLLSNRVSINPKSVNPEQSILHWVSRWALTSQPVLYYTLAYAQFDFPVKSTETLVVSDNIPYCTTSEKKFHWGGTSQDGMGIISYSNRPLYFERNVSHAEDNKVTFPTVDDVRNYCETLIQQLKYFTPIDPSTHRYHHSVIGSEQTWTPCFVQRWKEHGSNLLFAFSSGGWQINFYDHSKLIIHYPHMFAYSKPNSLTDGAETHRSTVAIFKEYEQLEEAFRKWVTTHQQHEKILQHLLFKLL